MGNSFKNLAKSLAAVLVVLLLSQPVLADSVPTTFTGTNVTKSAEYGFSQLTSNTVNIASNFDFQLFDLGSQIGVRFINTGPIASRIEEVYFYDGHLITNGTIVGPSGVFTRENSAVAPGDLPGFMPTKTGMHLTRFYAADAGSKGSGVSVGGFVDFKFDLLSGITLDRVIHDLTENLNPGPTATPFYVGIHVQDIGTSGKSDSYLASPSIATSPSPQPVPLPAPVWAGLTLMGGTALRRKWNNYRRARAA